MGSKRINSEVEGLLHTLRSADLTEPDWDLLVSLSSSDPFTHDAVQGLRALEQDERLSRLASIENSLLSLLRKQEKKHVRRTRLRYVAAIGILLVGSWTVWQLFPDQSAPLAMNEIIAPLKNSENSGLGELKETDAETASDLTDNMKIAVDKVKREIEKPQMTETEDDHVGQNHALSENQVQTQHEAQPESSSNELEGDSRSAKAKSKNAVAAVGNQEEISRETNSTVPTNMNNMASQAGDEQDTPIVMSTPIEYSANQDDNSFRVQNRNKQNFDADKNQGPRNTSYALAIPLGGWNSYYKYVRNQILIPEAATNASIEGTVFLEFDLKKDGTPYEFRITQSLGYGCDEEAIRIVREGPKWDVKNAQVEIGSVSIDF